MVWKPPSGRTPAVVPEAVGSVRETPNNVSGGGGLAAEGQLLTVARLEAVYIGGIRGVARFSCVVSGIKTESGCDQARYCCASRVCLTITRLARANSVCSCAVFFLRPR